MFAPNSLIIRRCSEEGQNSSFKALYFTSKRNKKSVTTYAFCSEPTNRIREIKITRPRNQSVMSLYGKKVLIVCNHHARFGGNRCCGSGDSSRDIMEDTMG